MAIDFDFNLPYAEEDFDAEQFYKDVIGVTVNEGLRKKNIKLWIDRTNAPYVITKPFHHSQKIEKQNEDGSIIISLDLKINNEFERLVLGFGNCIKVLSPENLQKRMIEKFRLALENYS